MATRADYRASLEARLLGLEDSGYGDFDYSSTELNDFLFGVSEKLFPALYKTAVEEGVTVTSYGTNGLYKATVPAGVVDDRIFMVEDAAELEPRTGWSVFSGVIRGLQFSDAVNVHYWEAYSLPDDDVTDAGIPSEWYPVIILGAEIECLQARHDTGLRPDPSTGYQQTALIDRLREQWGELKQELGMAPPVVVV